jgi:hypothetical protein
LLLLAGSTADYGTVTKGALIYSPLNAAAATAVPTLSASMIVILGLLLAAVSFRVAKQKGASNKHFLFGFIAVGMLAFSLSGKIIHSANVGGGGFSFLNLSQGGSLNIVTFGLNTFENNSGVTQRITSITLPPFCPNTNSGFTGQRCAVGLNLSNSQICFINCFIPAE